MAEQQQQHGASGFTVTIPESELPPLPADLTPPTPAPPAPPPRRRRWGLAVGAVCALALAAGALGLVLAAHAPQRQYQAAVAQGDGLLAGGDPRAAADAYARAWDLQPGGAAAEDGLYAAYAALADAAAARGNYDGAVYQMELCYALTDDPRAVTRADRLRAEQAEQKRLETLADYERLALQYQAEALWNEAAAAYRECLALTGDPRYEQLAQEQEAAKQAQEQAEAARSRVTASLPEGRYAPGAVVSLSCGDPSAHIYYTLDGSAPGQGSARYSGGVELGPDPGGYTLRAVAYRKGVRGPELLLRYEILAQEEE